MNGDSALYSLGSIATAGINSAANKSRQKYAFKKTMELQKQLQQWQEDMWNKANEYNLPINEVQRLLDAGINPALEFSNAGGGAAPVPSATSGSSIGVPSSNVPNLGEAVRVGQNADLVDSQVALNESTSDLQDAQSNALNAQAGVSNAQAGKIRTEDELLKFDLEVKRGAEVFLKQFPRLDFQMKQYSVGLLGYQWQRDGALTSVYGELLGSQVTQARQQVKLNDWAIKKASREFDYIGQQIQYLVQQGKVSEEQARYINHLAGSIALEGFMGDWMRESAESIKKLKYDPNTGENVNFSNMLINKLMNNFKMDWINSSYGLKSSENALSFENEFGLKSRTLVNWQLPHQQYNMNNWNTFFNGVNSVVGAGLSLGTAGMKAPMYRAITQSYENTQKRFVGRPIGF